MDHIVTGREAFQRGDFHAARSHFECALAEAESPEALEGVATAAGMLDDGQAAIPMAERAYRLYSESGDSVGAARVATLLADFYFLFRNQLQVANAWLQRARGLLAEIPLTVEHGYLAGEAAFLAFHGQHDAIAAGQLGAEAAACGRAMQVVDLVMYGAAAEGLALVNMGEIERGLSMLDEAGIAAMAGEITDPHIANLVLCSLIGACEWLQDYDRAEEWCAQLREYCRTANDDPTLLAVCRTHYAGVLMWKGDWNEAEQHLRFATETLGAVYPGLALEAYVRLGELRRRQGRWDDAARLFDLAEHESQTLIGRAAMALDQGDPQEAISWAERLLRRLAPEARIERLVALDLLVHAHLANGNVQATREPLDRMWEIVRAVGTGAARARVLAAEGACTAVTAGHASAVPFLEDSADLFHESGGAFESAVVRVALAESLRGIGRNDAAARELTRAIETFRSLGAEHYLARARFLLDAPATGQQREGLNALTAREREVLALVADGRSNAEIAEQLVLSVRTVERHLATVYEKLNLEGRNARAAAVSFALREGLLAHRTA